MAGLLEVETASGFTPKPGTSFTVLTASKIKGTFRNPNKHVVDQNGNNFSISYSETEVILTVAP